MSNDFEKGVRKTLDLSVKAKDFTSDTLKSVMQDFLNGTAKRKGTILYQSLRLDVAKDSNFDTMHPLIQQGGHFCLG